MAEGGSRRDDRFGFGLVLLLASMLVVQLCACRGVPPAPTESTKAASSAISSNTISSTASAQPALPAKVEQQAKPAEQSRIEPFERASKLLTDFWGRPQSIRAQVRLPAGYDPKQAHAVCYAIHGFSGNASGARAWNLGFLSRLDRQSAPPLIYVALEAQYPMGHHEFADSANNGPWGAALTQEFIPALEAHYGIGRGLSDASAGRFLTGHSSGGWASLWLQVNYPDFFGGCWATAPDSVDFRDFSGINVYEDESCYVDADGNPRPLVRRAGKVATTFEDFARQEHQSHPVGGQLYSFDAVFSPRGEDGTPMPMFDRDSGRIDEQVAAAWHKYDISLIVRNNWKTLGPKLSGKLHVYMGSVDTFYLDGGTRLFKQELEALGSDAEVLIVEERDHFSLMAPHPELWPQGMMQRIFQEMNTQARTAGLRAATAIQTPPESTPKRA